MFLARVTGNIVSTVKHSAYKGKKIMVVHKVNLKGKMEKEAYLAIDEAQAGDGDLVLLLLEGSSARTVLHNDTAPVRGIIMGIVDQVDIPSSC
ncbi:MAG: EutN/CcmL family microcompartment protein [bacterium]